MCDYPIWHRSPLDEAELAKLENMATAKPQAAPGVPAMPVYTIRGSLSL
jgi:hypothetical protein